jgi:hypothetical protein
MSNRAANPAAPPQVSLPAVFRATPCAKSDSGKGTHLQRRFVSHEPAATSLLQPSEAAALLEMHWETLVNMARKGTVPALGIHACWPLRVSLLNAWLEKGLVPPHRGEVQWTQPAALRESGEQE